MLSSKIEDFLPRPIVRKKYALEYRFAKFTGHIWLRIRSWRGVLIRWGMPTMVLLLAFPLGWAIGQMDKQGINPLFLIGALFAPLSLIVLQLSLTRFELSPVFILFTALFLRIKLPTGTESIIVGSLLFSLLYSGNWILRMFLEERRYNFKPSIVNFPFFGFAAITFWSFIWSLFFMDPLVFTKGNFPVVQGASAVVNIMLPLTMLLLPNHLDDIKKLRWMVILMLIGGAFSLFGRFLGASFLMLIINDGGLFTMCVAACGAGIGLFHEKLAWKWRILALVIGVSLQMFRFIKDISWMGGWMPGFLALGVIITMRSRKLLVLCILGVILFIVANLSYIESQMEAEGEESGETRKVAWQTNWTITSKHFFFGTGQAAYINYYTSYKTFGKTQLQANHNTIIDTIAQNGIFGLFFFFWLLLAVIWINFKLTMRVRGRRDFVEAMANIALAASISSLISADLGDWLFPFAYTQTIAGYDYIVYSWIFMGMGLALDNLVPSEKRARQS